MVNCFITLSKTFQFISIHFVKAKENPVDFLFSLSLNIRLFEFSLKFFLQLQNA
jgi:hypothetical protein